MGLNRELAGGPDELPVRRLLFQIQQSIVKLPGLPAGATFVVVACLDGKLCCAGNMPATDCIKALDAAMMTLHTFPAKGPAAKAPTAKGARR